MRYVEAVLQQAGATYADVIKVLEYYVIDEDVTFTPHSRLPVDELAYPAQRVEVEAIAWDK